MSDLMSLLAVGEDDDIYTAIIKDNLAKRVLIFNDEVNECLLENYIMHILRWNREDRDIPVEKRTPIWIIANSYGGDTIAGIMLLDVIMNSITPVKCLVMSMCASMASYIPMVCNESYSFENSVICLHDGQFGVRQTTRKARDVMGFYERVDEKLDDIVMNKTLITKEKLKEIADREYFMFAEEAKELGVINYIIGKDCTIDDILN